jgi:hypothetical protein
MHDLEVWLIGTPSEVDAALTALRTVGRIAGASRAEALYGADSGRVRRYLRVAVSAAPSRPARPAAVPALIDPPRRSA